MILKTDWNKYLHSIRQKEIEKVFGYLGNVRFEKGLEVGCGDGYQTTLLEKYCRDFISGDLNFKRIKEELKLPHVLYKQCDADNLEGVFGREEFDFIFSSNIIEHLGNPKSFLKNTNVFLKKDGYAVHIIPARPVKITYIIMHFPNLFITVLDRFIGLFQGKKIFRGENINLENNINKLDGVDEKSKFSRIFLPQVHGNFRSHAEEFIKFGRKNWEELFEENGYKVEKYIKGPTFSGYGFGINWLRNALQYLGWTSEHIFILKKI